MSSKRYLAFALAPIIWFAGCPSAKNQPSQTFPEKLPSKQIYTDGKPSGVPHTEYHFEGVTMMGKVYRNPREYIDEKEKEMGIKIALRCSLPSISFFEEEDGRVNVLKIHNEDRDYISRDFDDDLLVDECISIGEQTTVELIEDKEPGEALKIQKKFDDYLAAIKRYKETHPDVESLGGGK